MEDEDGESRSTDMWPILGERVCEPKLGNSLKHSNDGEGYTDGVGDDKQLQGHYSPVVTKDSSSTSKSTSTGPRLTFKGFKKRFLAEARELHSAVLRNSALEQQQLPRSNASTKSGGKERRAEGKHKITEYLGLQPSSRHKCSKCHGWLNCGPNSKQNLCVCSPSMTPMPSTSESASLPHASSNFKITRKVYLCAACGTYFENWNLFLHMRDIHKRHICLFCLGMFGQAERLLHHLSKKHNVPDLEFASEDEFYSVFKGSCYLVCCSCERIFSETDNFYNHFCSPTFKQDATAGMSVCTLCRQTGTHASTCNFALSSDADRGSYTPSTPVPTATDSTRVEDSSPAAAVPSAEKILNLGGKGLPRKAVKNNRSKLGAELIQNSHQLKLNALTRKFGARGRCNKSQSLCESDMPKEVVNNLTRDTVSETIMEVSRYTGSSSDENDENDEQAMNKDVSRDKGSDEKSPAQNHQLDCNEPYDSVTETIMEVSRCTSDTDEEDTTPRELPPTYTPDTRSVHATEKTNDDEMNISDGSDADSTHQLANSSAPSPVRWESEETAVTADTKTNVASYELEAESELRPYESPQNARSQSPVNRSLFSPRHESHTSEPQAKERESSRDDFSKEDPEKEKPAATSVGESQLSVSFNAVPSSDRSLVIKICTNRNSQFSVTSSTAVSRGSEENNNAEGSTTSKEKLANGSDREKDVVGDDQTNDLDDSDSDSDKLAVVDSNPEEDDEGEEGEEAEEADEVEDKCDDTIQIGSQEHSGDIGSGIFDVTETDVLSGDATEKLDNNGTEGTDGAKVTNDHDTSNDDGIALAGEDAPCMDLNVDGTLDSIELDELLKRCIEAASPICVYCNHARCIAVNGKQLGLHMLAEHKFQPQHPAIIIHAEQFTARVKRSLDELEPRYFNLNTYDSVKGTYNVPQVRMYECFHCRFHSPIHKELYLHNRKMHQKTILICIMCKSTFYSYSELLCHLCPGVYSPNMNLRYRCCLCSVNSLPSSFRLMVHLRKQHHACDVCLESTGNQQRLSNHVWKHKLHHLCYRCGIAYRNKPDITKHLFWKHGTESVLCRKCVQKKWPYIYHFCIPPAEFKCDECECKFKRAVALKVHKRLHSTNLPYGCDECSERFISRKLLAKHQASHREPEPQDVDVNVTDVDDRPPTDRLDEKSDKDKTQTGNEGASAGAALESVKDAKEAVKRVVDVYDLPPLNLSSESDTDNEEEKVSAAEKSAEKEKIATENEKTEKSGETVEEVAVDGNAALVNDIVDVERNEEEKKQEERIMDGIWDNFKTYAASLEMKDSTQSFALKENSPEPDPAYLKSIVLADHDYCVVWSNNGDQVATSKEDDGKEEQDDVKSRKSPSPGGSPSHNASCESDATKRAKVKSPKKKKRSGSTSSSDSSSDTDSSSCSCGTNCSCSSSSSGSSSSSSSSSDSDSSTSESSPKKQSSRRERGKKEKENARENKSDSVEPENNKPEEVAIENGIVTVDDVVTNEPALPLMRESDLETDETVTDEDFYDEHPQQLANTKRNQLMLLATVSTSVEQCSTQLNNGVAEVTAESTTLHKPITMAVEERPQQKRKTKTKKRRKGERTNKRNTTAAATTSTMESIKLNIPKAYYQKNPAFAASSPAMLPTLNPSRSSTPNLPVCNDLHGVGGALSGGTSSSTMEMLQTPVVGGVTAPMYPSMQNVGGNGSETENKRSSKRKRVPKRFYGDSSDDEPQEKQQVAHKWTRKTAETVVPAFAPPPVPVAAPLSMTTSTPMANPKSMPPSRLSFGGKMTQQAYRPGQMESQQQALPVTLASATESEGAAETSSDSSESETEVDDSVSHRRTYNDLPPASETAPAATERPVKIYCYCRCPYDEVSEMIACDGEDCRIEWFHFECVGIMVPPKGKWYCPDCRRKHNITQNNDEYCD
ncbi:uncharacterized protein LOC105181876 [Harpegnathos saltator]|uniref:Chromatin modification-related protein YNG2 n=1 Tax=Harpegnathos saltator TaxID=610380 RepID=E2BEC1_HARSA|nr:uncharacterized protein LOC105181876 [Harpegnathos saltator]EFN85966.1 Chromatin modification-related protein YNG2 [Harpegnathos saltator]